MLASNIGALIPTALSYKWRDESGQWYDVYILAKTSEVAECIGYIVQQPQIGFYLFSYKDLFSIEDYNVEITGV